MKEFLIVALVALVLYGILRRMGAAPAAQPADYHPDFANRGGF